MTRSSVVLVVALSVFIELQLVNAVLANSRTDDSRVVSALNKFSTSLYQVVIDVSGRNQNVVMSPLSVYTVAAMSLAGARRNTAVQIESVLRLKDTHNETAFNAIGNLAVDVKVGTGATMRAVNLLFVASGYHLKPEFQSILQEHFGAKAQAVDFRSDETRVNINRQVEESTNRKIKDLIPPKSMDSSTKMALISAVYFKSNWRRQFDPTKTRKRPFYVGSLRKKVMVAMMRTRDRFRAADLMDLDARVLELPYSGSQSMLILLPNRLNGLGALETTIAASNKMLSLLDKRLRRQTLTVVIPRFKIQGSFDLKKALIRLGMTDLFDNRKADLSGISPSNELYVSDAFHKAVIEVNERGTEAAAASAMIVTSRQWQPDPFVADHPFIFIIRDDEKKSILFMGRLADPTPTN